MPNDADFRWVKPSSENEMIAEFLCQEYASTERYGATIKAALAAEELGTGILTNVDLNDAQANADRKRLFARYRGYGTAGDSYFTSFPAGAVEWGWYSLTREELLTTLFVRYWAGIWGSEREPRALARRIRAGEVDPFAIEDGWIAPHVARANRIAAGEVLPPLILVSADNGATRVAMEGNSRLTSYALAEPNLPETLLVLMGKSSKIAEWDEY